MKICRAVPLAFALATAACGNTSVKPPDASVTEPPDAAPSPRCLEAVNHSDLDWLEDNVFTPNCASFSVCHQGNASDAGDLSLDKGRVAGSLINQPSIQYEKDGLILVVPGDPDSSYLMVLLGSRPGMLPDVGTMPYASPILCKQKRDAIERWITSLGTVDAGVPGDGGVTDAGIGDAG